MAFGEEGKWVVRHISPSSEDYVDQAVTGVTTKADALNEKVNFKLVFGSPRLANTIITSLAAKGRNIDPENVFIENPEGSNAPDYQEKHVVHLAQEKQLLIHLLRDQNIVQL